MPRIRRGGKRIRGANGGRTRKEDCCCGATLTCSEWNNSSVKSLLLWGVEFNGLTIGTNGCTNCAGVALSQVLSWECNFDTAYDDSWCRIENVGCRSCTGGIDFCSALTRLKASCFGDSVTLTLLLGVCASSFLGCNWLLELRGTFPVSALTSGTTHTLTYHSYSAPGATVCTPTGYATSTADVTFS